MPENLLLEHDEVLSPAQTDAPSPEKAVDIGVSDIPVNTEYLPRESVFADCEEEPEKNPKKNSHGGIFFAFFILGAVTLSLFLYSFGKLKSYNELSENFSALSESCAGLQSDLSSALEQMKSMEQTIIFDDGLHQTPVEKYKNVPVSSYNPEYFIDSEGFKYYKPGSEVVSTLGIDLSYHQGTVYWQNVADAGIDFAIIRCGFRGYGTGEVKGDTQFTQNINGAIEAGVDVGVYFYSQAISKQEAIDEANFVLNAISGYDIKYPVVFDWEYVSTDEARTDDMKRDELTDAAIAFCETIKAAGYTPMIYANASTAIFRFDLSRLTEYDFWLAQYSDTPDYYYDYQMWQYTSNGIVDGISTYVDLNVCLKKYE